MACSWCVAAPIPALEHLNMSYTRASTSRKLTLPSSLYSYDLLQMSRLSRLSNLMFALLYLEITSPIENHTLSGCINNRLSSYYICSSIPFDSFCALWQISIPHLWEILNVFRALVVRAKVTSEAKAVPHLITTEYSLPHFSALNQTCRS